MPAQARASASRSRPRREHEGGELKPTAEAQAAGGAVVDPGGVLPLRDVAVAEATARSAREPLDPAMRERIKWDSRRRRSLALGDALALFLSYILVWWVSSPTAETWSLDRVPLLVMVPLWIFLNKLLRLYDRDANLIHKSTLNELPSIIQSISLGVGLIYLLLPEFAGVHFTREGTIFFWLSAIVLTPTLRFGARALVRRQAPLENCLIVGASDVTDILTRKLAAHPGYGVRVVGCLDVAPPGAWHEDESLPYFELGEHSAFEETCRALGVDRVIIAFAGTSHEQLLEIISSSKRLQLKITVVPRLFEMIGGSVETDEVEGMTLLGLRGFSRTRSSLALKRAIDVIGAGAGLILLSPLLILIAIAVKLTSPGPVLYGQRRIGRGNRPFRLYKFRTMVDDADRLKPSLAHLNEAKGPMFKIADDPRMTPLGRHLRRTSLDELPQLWNVLRGEMSLVGPRPLVPSEDDHVIGRHRARLSLTPGLTGPWQVLGRTRIPFHEMIKLDYLYVAEWSLWNDIKLLLRTAPVVVFGRGN